jgi:hypothetical protein
MSRWWSRALIVVVAVLALSSISISCGRTLAVSTMQGAPIPGAYVAYHREGNTFGLIESLTYQASRIGVLKTDASGRAVIPGAVHMHWPIVQSHPEIAVNLIYAPPLHNGLASVNRRVAVSRPQEYEVSDDLRAVRLDDVSGDPSRWRGTLENLSSLLGRLRSQEMRGEETPGLTDELIEQFQNEYRAILDRYGDVLRARPDMPEVVRWSTDQEKVAWQSMVDKDLAERPHWGDELKRRFSTEIDIYLRQK